MRQLLTLQVSTHHVPFEGKWKVSFTKMFPGSVQEVALGMLTIDLFPNQVIMDHSLDILQEGSFSLKIISMYKTIIQQRKPNTS